MILQYSKSKLSSYFKSNMNLRIDDTDKPLVKKIIQYEDEKDLKEETALGSGLRIPQISID